MNPVCSRYTSLRYINIGEGEMLLPPSMTILNGDMVYVITVLPCLSRAQHKYKEARGKCVMERKVRASKQGVCFIVLSLYLIFHLIFQHIQLIMLMG